MALRITLPAEARAAIDGHVRLLLAWNGAINLTAIREPAAIAVRHVADSLTALPVLRARGIDRFIDLGSGGGFPGIPLAAALPADRALLVDSIGKKVRFLATVIAAVGLADRVAAEAARSEQLAATSRDRGAWPAVTARAVGSLAELVELALPLLAPGGVLIAWKQGGIDDPAGLGGELAAARRALDAIDRGARIDVEAAGAEAAARPGVAPAAHPEAIAALAGHRLIVVERGPHPIDPAWPREPATRRRAPW